MHTWKKEELLDAAELVHRHQPATAQYSWPLLNEAVGTEVWVKHENHTSTGAFKVRGGITFLHWLSKTEPKVKGIITATRGNHGQSQAKAATAFGMTAKVIVPEGNSQEKNAAMNSFGADVIVSGKDFDESRAIAQQMSQKEQLYLVPPFHKEIVSGVASYALELMTTIQNLDEIYVPIGCGSGICGLIAVRDALKLKTKIIGVVSTNADAAKQSFETGRITQTNTAYTFADGMAVRQPVEAAFNVYKNGAEKIVAVTDDEVANAIRLYYKCTHNIAEGAGAAPLAAALQMRHKIEKKKVAVILCGGNIDTAIYEQVLRGETPSV